MTQLVVGLTGVAGSGKDYAASFISTAFNPHIKFAFADPLYRMAASIGIDIDYYSERENKEKPIEWLSSEGNEISLRKFLQLAGTEFGRNMIQDDIWLRIAAHKLDAFPDYTAIITDVRFPNEHKFVKSRGGIIIRCEAENNPYSTQTNHVSESYQLEADYTVHNDYTERFAQRLSKVIDKIKECANG